MLNNNAMMSSEHKARRRKRIQQVLQRGPVGSQDELLRLLEEEGIATTQATISRDLRALGAVRTSNGYTLPAHMPTATPNGVDGSALRDALRQYLTGTERAGTIVVLRTGPGHAGALATEVDGARLPTIVGTIAGDDTIFAAARSETAANTLLKHLREMAAME